jgi:trehalose synthase
VDRAPWLSDVAVTPLAPGRLNDVLTADGLARFEQAIARGQELLADNTLWTVNSTASGGGVAEMLRSLIGYVRGAGLDARWVVIGGDAGFFRVTKHLHNHLHGADDGATLGEAERAIYERHTARCAAELVGRVTEGDVVLLHDPQTAGMVGPLVDAGVPVIWRAHIGLDAPNAITREAWRFLIPYVEPADAYVFSRPTYAWEGLDRAKVHIIPPSIDAFAPKNQAMGFTVVTAVLRAAGLAADHHHPSRAVFERLDGSVGRVQRPARLIEEAAPHLVLAGPDVAAVADDPEGAEVLAEVEATWHALPTRARRRVHLAMLPMEDADENAVMVNALQRRSDVVVQKSIAEGFGLTVAEAMWKGRPVVATTVGGIQDQIEDGVTGRLVGPHDLAAFGERVSELLADPHGAERLGAAAQARVREHFLGARHLGQYVDLLESVLA